MPDRQRPRQVPENVLPKDIRHQPQPRVSANYRPVRRRNPGRLLPPVLQRVQAVITPLDGVLRPGKPAYVPFGALCYYTLPRWARDLYGVLPEVPQPAVTAALRAFRLGANSVPEPIHGRLFQPGTRRMLAGARERLAAEGYDLSRGLFGLKDPRRWPEHR